MSAKNLEQHEELDETVLFGLRILQKKKGWRFSVDSVVLSTFCVEMETTHFRNEPKRMILDVGTGCGVIPILTQKLFRKNLEILPTFVGVDIDTSFAKISYKNFKLNNLNFWTVVGDIRAHPFKEKTFDIVISNPPYIPVGEGRISPKYDVAKWEITFSLREFAKSSHEVLKDGGRIYVAYSSRRLGELLSVFFKAGLRPSFVRFFHHSPSMGSDFFVLVAQKGGRRKLEVLPPIFGGAEGI